jgi:hypothetical protein
MLGERMPARAVEPDKGGRGVPIWMRQIQQRPA